MRKCSEQRNTQIASCAWKMCLMNVFVFKSELEAIRKNENISLRIMRYCMFCFSEKNEEKLSCLCVRFQPL